MTKELLERVFVALGQASMCWSVTPRGIFESGRAKAIGDDLVAAIKDAITSAVSDVNKSRDVEKRPEPTHLAEPVGENPYLPPEYAAKLEDGRIRILEGKWTGPDGEPCDGPMVTIQPPPSRLHMAECDCGRC